MGWRPSLIKPLNSLNPGMQEMGVVVVVVVYLDIL